MWIKESSDYSWLNTYSAVDINIQVNRTSTYTCSTISILFLDES
jgi:hypothetical protein